MGSRLLRRDHLLVPLEHDSLPGVIGELVTALVQSGAVSDRAAIAGAIDADPARSTVSISPLILLPHYRTDAVDQAVIALGVAAGPLPATGTWAAGARIVALVLAPADAATVYLRTVSALARVLRQAAVVEALLAARSPDDVLAIEELAGLSVEPAIAAAGIMVRTEAARPDDTLRAAVEIMVRNDARGLPVVGDKGEILGLVTEADVLRGLLQSRPRADDDTGQGLVPPLRVRDVMERSVMCISDAADLDDVANLLVSKNAELFPVVAEGRLIGLVRRVDILRKLYGR